MTGTNLFRKEYSEPSDLWSRDNITNPNAPSVVLVVDDSRMQRKMLTTSLRKWGYEVVEAETGQQGIEVCENHDVKMVISDWMMPGMNGPEFCQKFRQLERGKYGYFVLLTSKGESREIAEGLNSGADDFLTKPVSFGELKARLRAGERIVNMHSQLMKQNRVVNETLDAMRLLYDGLEKDLIEARKLQQSLVRDTDIKLARARLGLMLRPSGHVGGDLVGQFRVNSNEIGMFSLDVSGHGVTSALMTARLAGHLSSLSPSQNIALEESEFGQFTARDPAQTAALLNDALLRDLETDHYFTMVLAIVNLTTGNVRCVQAGHPHPVLIHENGEQELLGAGGLPIGLVPDAEFESFEFHINVGDKLFLYSDGLTEATNQQGAMLDEDGLSQFLEKCRNETAPQLLNRVVQELVEFCGTEEFEDDVSALVLDYSGGTEES